MNRWSKPWGKNTSFKPPLWLPHTSFWWFGTYSADEWGEVAPTQFVKSPGSMSCDIFDRIADLISTCMRSLVVMMRKCGTTVTCCTVHIQYEVSACHYGGTTYQRPSQQPHSGWQSQTWDMIHWQHSNQSAGTDTLLPVHHTTLSVVRLWHLLSCYDVMLPVRLS